VQGVALVIIAKAPAAGRSKTRLCPPFTPEQAAALARAALLDTLEAVAAAPARRRILALEGEPDGWLSPGFELHPQRGAGLGERLGDALAAAGGPALVVGMDTPSSPRRCLLTRPPGWPSRAWTPYSARRSTGATGRSA
jgi:glycosyltransferase A (GT-A) superfamily protein (DUF2064 family)